MQRRPRRTPQSFKRTDRSCLGWPEIGACDQPAQTDRRHNRGRWSPRYCCECDALRLAHSGSPGIDAGDEDRVDFGDLDALEALDE